MASGMGTHCWSVLLALTVLSLLPSPGAGQDRIFDMDRLATCGQDITVFENEVVLNGRSNAAPANPPLECTVYLKSGYTESDGRYRLQIIIEAIDIKDCQVHVDVFNGRGAYGSYLRSLGCNSMSTDTLYTENRQATVRFTRPSILYQTAYTFTFKIRTYRDIDGGGYDNTTIRLSPGAIIGIIVGIVALFVVAVLILWCYRTGRIGGFYSGVYREDNFLDEKSASKGENNDGVNLEKSESLGSAIDYRDPGVWSSVTNGIYNPDQPMKLGRNFQKKANNKYGNVSGYEAGTGTEDGYRQSNDIIGRGIDSTYDDSYEPYERDKNVHLSMKRSGNVAEWNKEHGFSGGNENLDENEKVSFKRSYGAGGSRGSRGSKGIENSPSTKRASFADRKDHEGSAGWSNTSGFDSKLRCSDRDSTRQSGREGETNQAEIDLIQSTSEGITPALSSTSNEPKREQIKDCPFFSDDEPSKNSYTNEKHVGPNNLQCETKPEPNSDQNHFHSEVSPPNENKKTSLSPSRRRKKRGTDGKVDIGLLPEANDPIFTVPVADTPYDPSASLPYTSYGVPSYDAMYPYGMTQIGGFAPVPGQTFAYYQMGPMPGTTPSGLSNDQQPMFAGQAAWYVQDTPQGPVQKAFMVTAEASKGNNPRENLAPENSFCPSGTPGYSSTPANFLKPKRGRKKGKNGDPMDISVIASGGPPPEPGAGQRSSVMRKGVDPKTGMQVKQIVWRDTIVDPTDPPADANPQITRKTLTRITTHSGHGDLPTDQNPVAYNDYSDRLGIESENPEFLSPSRTGGHTVPPALTHTPDGDNQAFYLGRHPQLNQTGQQSHCPEPVIHDATSRNMAFRDRIAMEHSEA